MPCDENQRRSRCRCDETGNTTPNVYVRSRRERTISSRKVFPSRTPRCHKSSESVMALPLRFKTSAVRQSQAIEPKPSAAATGMAGERVGGFQFAVNDLVADRRPAKFAAQLDAQTKFSEQSQFVRHHQRGAIGQRHEAKPDGLTGWLNPVGGLRFFVHVAAIPGCRLQS